MYSFKHDVRRNVALSRQIHPLFFKKRPDGKYYCLKKKKTTTCLLEQIVAVMFGVPVCICSVYLSVMSMLWQALNNNTGNPEISLLKK